MPDKFMDKNVFWRFDEAFMESRVFSKAGLGDISVYIDENNNYWFSGRDVCNSLGITNAANKYAQLDETDQKDFMVKHPGERGGAGKVKLITEAGLYDMVCTTRTPVASEFRKWITHIVIPELRAHGAYVVGQERLALKEQIAQRQKAEEAYKRVAEKLKDVQERAKQAEAAKTELSQDNKKLKEKLVLANEDVKQTQQVSDNILRDLEKAQQKNTTLASKLAQYEQSADDTEKVEKMEKVMQQANVKEQESAPAGPKVYYIDTKSGFIYDKREHALNKYNNTPDGDYR